MKKTLQKYIKLTILLFISALNFNFFINPSKIVSGGANGLTVILQSFIDLPPSLISLIILSTFLLISLFADQYDLLISAIYSSFMYPFFISLTENITNIVSAEYTNMILICVFSGLISGIISGYICKFGLSGGGIVLLCQTIYSKFKISISKSNLIINASIVFAGGYIFGVTNILYSLIFIYTSKVAFDKVMLGISSKKIFYIMTNKVDDVSLYIKEKLGGSYTIFDATGGYKKHRKHVIMTSIATSDYFRLKEGIHEIDNSAFFVITDSYEVKGGK